SSPRWATTTSRSTRTTRSRARTSSSTSLSWRSARAAEPAPSAQGGLRERGEEALARLPPHGGAERAGQHGEEEAGVDVPLQPLGRLLDQPRHRLQLRPRQPLDEAPDGLGLVHVDERGRVAGGAVE